MVKLIKKSNWFVGSMIFFMPILLIFFLASQMAYSQVNSRFEAYRAIPELSRLADLEQITPGQIVMLRGRVSESSPQPAREAGAQTLAIYQERPAAGREVRFREEFPLVFPKFIMELSDGPVIIVPSQTREHVIQNERHTVAHGDRIYTGFRPGDTVTVQGEWQPVGPEPGLVDVTGISGTDKQSLMQRWQQAFRQVSWVRNVLGFLTLLSIILLIVQLRHTRSGNQSEEPPWPDPKTPTTTTV